MTFRSRQIVEFALVNGSSSGAERRDIQLDFIQPDNPLHNAYIARYNLTVR